MKSLQEYINESESKTDLSTNKVQPKTKDELKEIIKDTFEHKQYDLNFIDTSKITDMCELFEYIEHNFNISKWDTSNVKNMSYMFYRCYKFTGKGIGNWNISNVKDIGGMFAGCEKFDCDLSNWDVSNVTDMNYVFIDCEKFKGKGLENWNVTNVTNMRRMFDGCNKLTIPDWYK